MTNLNLDSLFSDMAEQTELTSELTFLKQGDSLLVALCPPLEYEGKETLVVMVESNYRGKKGKQFIVRFIKIPKNGKDLDFDKATVIGIPLPATVVSQIAKMHELEYSIAVQECSVLMLSKNPKTEVQASPKTVTIPNDLWESTGDLSWESLVESYEQIQDSKDEEKEKTADTPW